MNKIPLSKPKDLPLSLGRSKSPSTNAIPPYATLYAHSVSAGFPSCADDAIETALDLNTHLIQHPAATFFVRVSGDSMINAGIHDTDILIVDRSLSPESNDIVIAVIHGDLTVKRWKKHQGQAFLCPENPAFESISLTEEMNCQIWGVVTTVIHRTR